MSVEMCRANSHETQSCVRVCRTCGGKVCLVALSTKVRWKIAWFYKQHPGNLIKCAVYKWLLLCKHQNWFSLDVTKGFFFF